MLERKIEFRRILIFDFSGAFLAGIIYLLILDILTSFLNLPQWVATTQMGANFIYGIFGAAIYFSKTKKLFVFVTLVSLNFIYGVLSMGAALALFEAGRTKGAALVLVEGFYVFALALFERKNLPTD